MCYQCTTISIIVTPHMQSNNRKINSQMGNGDFIGTVSASFSICTAYLMEVF